MAVFRQTRAAGDGGDSPCGVAQTVDAERRAIRGRNGFEEEYLGGGTFHN
jgi:hypothetical protein